MPPAFSYIANSMIRLLFWIFILYGIIPATAQESAQQKAYIQSQKYLNGTWHLYLPDPHNNADSLVAIRKFKGFLTYVGSMEFLDSTLLIFKKHYKCATGIDFKKEYAPRTWQLTQERLLIFDRYKMQILFIYNDTMILRALKTRE